jgi:hypothetical protein
MRLIRGLGPCIYWAFATFSGSAIGAEGEGGEKAAADPVEYMEGLQSIQMDLHIELHHTALRASLSGSLDACLDRMSNFRQIVHKARRKVGLYPPFEGDGSLRDGVLQLNDRVIHVLDTLGDKRCEVAFRQVVTEDSALEVGRINVALDEELTRLDTDAKVVLREFADRHNIVLVPGPPLDLPELPEFECQVPPDSNLLPGQYAGLSIQYLNQFIAQSNAIIEETNAYTATFKGNDAKSQEAADVAQERLGKLCEQIRKVEPWFGDATLGDAYVAGCSSLRAHMNGPLRLVREANARGFESQEEVDAANEAIDGWNKLLDDWQDSRKEATTQFEKAHFVAEFAAYVKEADEAAEKARKE